MKPPTHDEWADWVQTVRGGDVVSVYYASGDHIFDARVRITKTGKIFLSYLDGSRRPGDRTNWRRYTVRVIGGGDRRIYKHLR